MKLVDKRNYKTPVALTDRDGETRTFGSLAEAARFLEVSRAAVAQALRTGCRCRGCRVEKLG